MWSRGRDGDVASTAALIATGWSEPVPGGFTVFLAYLSYLVYELVWEPAKPYADRSEPHWVNAIIGLGVFGLPGLYVAVRGKYPKWGKGAKAFTGEMDSLPDEESHYESGRKS